MPVFRWGHSWDAFKDLEREVDRILSGVNFSLNGIRLGRQYPPVNLYEDEEEYLLTAELPGINIEDLELTISSGILTMKGSRKFPEEVPEHSFRRQERFQGEWQRSFSIPDRVNEDALSADFNDGILKIHLPKAEEVKTIQIPVTEGGE